MRKLSLLALAAACLVAPASAQVIGNHNRAQCTPGPASPYLYDFTTPGVYYDCTAVNTYSARNYGQGGGGTGSVSVVGSGSLGNTQIVTGGGAQAIQTPATNATLSPAGDMSVNSLGMTGAGGWRVTGLEAAIPGAPAAGSATMGFDAVTHNFFLINTTGTFYGVQPYAGAAHQVITALAASGILSHAQLSCSDLSDSQTGCSNPAGGGSGFKLSQWMPLGVCVSGGAQMGIWSADPASSPTPHCLGFILGSNTGVGALNFPNTADTTVWLQTLVPTGWTSGTVAMKFISYPGASAGDVRYGIATQCIANLGVVGSFNAEQFVIRSQTTAFNQAIVTFSGLTMTGCSAGNVLVIKLRRQVACTGCTNGNMADIEYISGGQIEIN